jgi:uncharacterized membrane protein
MAVVGPDYERLDYWLAAVFYLITFFVYAGTTAPTIVGGDAGELVSCLLYLIISSRTIIYDFSTFLFLN